MTATQPDGGSGRSSRHPLIRFCASIWWGIVLLVLMLIYLSVFSAFPQVRGALELTEMQAFSHWTFLLLTILFMLSLFAATFARVAWHEVNLGAITAHVGLLLLCGGSLEYFGTKVEGDLLLQSPRVVIRGPVQGEMRRIGKVLAEPGQLWQEFAPVFGGALEVRIDDVLSSDKLPVAGARVSARAGDQPPQQFTLTRDQPTAQLGERLTLELVTYPPQQYFYDDEVAAMYFRGPQEQSLVKRLDALPIHRERYLPGGETLVNTKDEPVPSKRTTPQLALGGLTLPTGWFERWRMPLTIAEDELPFTVRITGYVPYVAGLRQRPGQEPSLIPVLEPIETRRAAISPRSMSAIRVELTGRGPAEGWSHKAWMLYSAWLEVDVRPLKVEVPGVGEWELVYSRKRHDLGASLVGKRLSVDYFPGRRGIESYRSDFQVNPPSGEPYAAAVHTNYTYTIGDWTLFQSGASGDDHWSYTILGVGNRNGIMMMNFGWIIVTLGCLYAFYVKPVLMRRLKAQGKQK